MTLPREIEKQISDRGDELTEKLKTDTPFNIGYIQGFIDGHEARATEWAGKASGLADALQRIIDNTEHEDYGSIHETCPACIAQHAIKQYKEVGNA